MSLEFENYIKANLTTNDTSGDGRRLKVDIDGSSFTVSENLAEVGGNVVTSGAGAVAAGTLRVTLASDDPAVAALQLIDNAVSGAGFNITQYGGVNVATGSGNATGALRVELPTNGTGVIATVGAVTAITNALPAGTAILGKVGIDQTTPGTTNGVQVNAALPAGANIIGNVRVDQTTPGTTNAVSVAQIGATTVTTGAGASSAGTQRVITATDSTIGTVTTVSSLTSGNLGGFTTYVSSTVVMSAAGAYATGDYMGTTTTPQSFANAVRTSGGTGIIESLIISDKIVTANVAMELWLFSATFVAPTDNAAWAISDAEALTVLAVIPIATNTWYASSNNQIYSVSGLNYPIKLAATSLFYALVSRGTTPAFTSADLTINLGILQD